MEPRQGQPDSEREQRREAVRRHTRRQRLIAVVVGAGCLSFLLFYFVLIPLFRDSESTTASQSASPSPQVTLVAVETTSSASASPGPGATTQAGSSAEETSSTAVADAPKRPRIVQKPITFGAERRKQMEAYSKRHYGDSSAVLDPKVIVLHYTAGGSWDSAWNLFQSNTPNVDELPGTVTHFIIDKDGTIYQLIPLDLRGRHTIGLNNVALGIEFVEEGAGGSTAAVHNIFSRKKQINAGLALVRWLQYRFDIPTKDVIGHGTADKSRYFEDLQGWTNDHADWGPADVRLFQKRLKEAAKK